MLKIAIVLTSCFLLVGLEIAAMTLRDAVGVAGAAVKFKKKKKVSPTASGTASTPPPAAAAAPGKHSKKGTIVAVGVATDLAKQVAAKKALFEGLEAKFKSKTIAVADIKTIVPKKLAVNYANEAGWTLVHLAAFWGRKDILEFLAAVDNFNVNKQNVDANTPLHLASSQGKPEIVKYLLSLGADATIKNRKGKTAEELATIEKVKVLFRQKTDVFTTLARMFIGESVDEDRVIEALTKAIRAKTITLYDRGEDGWTLWHLAAYHGKLNVLEFLRREYFLDTPTLAAAKTAHQKKSPKKDISFFLNTKNHDGNTPVHLAVIRKQKAVLEFLFSLQPNLTITNNGGQTAEALATTEEIKQLFMSKRPDKDKPFAKETRPSFFDVTSNAELEGKKKSYVTRPQQGTTELLYSAKMNDQWEKDIKRYPVLQEVLKFRNGINQIYDTADKNINQLRRFFMTDGIATKQPQRHLDILQAIERASLALDEATQEINTAVKALTTK